MSSNNLVVVHFIGPAFSPRAATNYFIPESFALHQYHTKYECVVLGVPCSTSHSELYSHAIVFFMRGFFNNKNDLELCLVVPPDATNVMLWPRSTNCRQGILHRLQCIWYMYLVGVPMNYLTYSCRESTILNRGMVYMSVSGQLLAVVGY